MGYTHYWRTQGELNVEKFALASADCKKICDLLAIPLQCDTEPHGQPVFTGEKIEINGVDDDGCETFQVLRQGTSFEFCKTRQNPYDLAVTCCLLILKHHLGDAIRVSSDGDEPDWSEARVQCQQHLGYGAETNIFPGRDDEEDD